MLIREPRPYSGEIALVSPLLRLRMHVHCTVRLDQFWEAVQKTGDNKIGSKFGLVLQLHNQAIRFESQSKNLVYIFKGTRVVFKTRAIPFQSLSDFFKGLSNTSQENFVIYYFLWPLLYYAYAATTRYFKYGTT